MNVEFDAPEGYVEPTYEKKTDKVIITSFGNQHVLATGTRASPDNSNRLSGIYRRGVSSRWEIEIGIFFKIETS